MEVFSDTFIPADLHAWYATRGCPTCLAGPLLRGDSVDDETHWVCCACGRCYRVEHGLLRFTDPLACHGCRIRTKLECITRLEATFPQFTGGAAADNPA